MAELRLSVKFPSPSRRQWLVAGAVLVVLAVAGAVTYAVTQRSAATLLPKSVSKQVDFKPYFFEGTIPGGYTLDPSDAVYSSGLLSMQLTKPGGQAITINEQTLPSKLDQKSVLNNGTKTPIPYGTATTNEIEGQFLGSAITRDDPKILILITTSSSGDRNQIVTMLKNLRQSK